jgi:two-component system response regulator FimZ (fimbrial Z protein)/two-component system response regulator EvgA
MRIAVADHHAHSLWALRTLLEEEPEFDLVGEAVDAQGLFALVDEHTVDLVLVDRELPGSPIQDLIASLKAMDPAPFVIVMSSEFEYSRMLLQAGADAFVSKGDMPGWLVDTLHRYARRTK